MKTSNSKSPLIYSFSILVLRISCVVSSYQAPASFDSSHKPLKFYMKSWHHNVAELEDEPNGIMSSAIPNRNSISMLVNISFGTPPVPQLLLMDTASDLIWIQCASCTKCFNQTAPLYDPSKSSTYKDVDCSSTICKSPLRCNTSGHICTYSIQYVSKNGSKGKMGLDQLTFETDHGIVTESGVAFGCGIENKINPRVDYGSGSLGLRVSPLSLTSQKGRQFSYCIGNLSDHSYQYNLLIIGEGAIFQGKVTPLEVYKENYHVTMEGISVGEKLLDIDPKIFLRSPSGVGGVVVDSGTTFSYIPGAAYEALKAEVISLIGSLWNIRYTGNDDLCYWASMSKTTGFPTVKFHLAGGVDLDIRPNSFFIQVNWFTICMAVNPAREGGHSYIGLVNQQYYNFGYDVDGKKLYLDNINCESLDD